MVEEREGGVKMKEHLIDYFSFINTEDWQDIFLFLKIVFFMKILIVYTEEQNLFPYFSSFSNLRREPLLLYIPLNVKGKESSIFTCFMLNFIAKVVKKREDEEDINLTYCITLVLST
ncbi:hypothetical protein BK708_14880 [Bacillus thuringiensis serovar yunnanensis]|nr:hypothetical protein BK708_14880 [Bacillus thuringiensis serovar yunnanensis]